MSANCSQLAHLPLVPQMSLLDTSTTRLVVVSLFVLLLLLLLVVVLLATLVVAAALIVALVVAACSCCCLFVFVPLVSLPTHWVPINIRFHVLSSGSGPFDCPRGQRRDGQLGLSKFVFIRHTAPRGVCVICHYKHARQAGAQHDKLRLVCGSLRLRLRLPAPASKHFESSAECGCSSQ